MSKILVNYCCYLILDRGEEGLRRGGGRWAVGEHTQYMRGDFTAGFFCGDFSLERDDPTQWTHQSAMLVRNMVAP